MSSEKHILVYGGSGALGSSCVSYFREHSYNVINIDFTENAKAQKNVLVGKRETSWAEQEEFVHKQVADCLAGSSAKLDAIFCVAGGWAGGNAADKDMIGNADLMWKQSVWSSAIAATLAAKYLRSKGTLILTGATPAYDGGTPGMIGYGMAKAAVIQLTKSLAVKQSGLPEEAFVCCIMPETLDTPNNRKYMPDGDVSKWTPLGEITKKLLAWTEEQERPKSGSLIKILTRDHVTQFQEAA